MLASDAVFEAVRQRVHGFLVEALDLLHVLLDSRPQAVLLGDFVVGNVQLLRLFFCARPIFRPPPRPRP